MKPAFFQLHHGVGYVRLEDILSIQPSGNGSEVCYRTPDGEIRTVADLRTPGIIMSEIDIATAELALWGQAIPAAPGLELHYVFAPSEGRPEPAYGVTPVVAWRYCSKACKAVPITAHAVPVAAIAALKSAGANEVIPLASPFPVLADQFYEWAEGEIAKVHAIRPPQ